MAPSVYVMGADPNLPEAQIHIQLMTGGQPHGDDLWAPVHIEESATLGALLPSTSDLEGIFAYWASMARPATRGARGGGEWPRGHVGARVVCGPMTTAIDVDDITLAGLREVAVATRCNVWLVYLVDTPQPLLNGAAAHTPSPRPTEAGPGGAPGPQARGGRASAATAPPALTYSPGQHAAATAMPGSPASATPRAAPGKGRKRRKTRPRPDTSARGSGSGSDDAGRGDTSDAGKDSDYRQAEDEETDTDDTSDAPGSATAEEGDGDDGAPVAVNIVLETRGHARLSQREKHAIDPAAKQMRLEQEPRPLGFVDISTAIGDNGEATAAAHFEVTRTEGGLTSFVVHGSLRPEKGDSSLRARRAVTTAALQCGIDKLDRDGRFDDHHGATVMVTVDLGAVPIARNVSRGSRENTQGRCNEHAGGVQDVVERQGLDMKVTVRADGDGPAARWAEVRQTAGPAVAAGAVRGAGATAPTGPAPGSTAGPGNGHAAGAQTATAPVAWMAQCPHDTCKCKSTTAGALHPVRHTACPTTGHLRDGGAPGLFCPVCPGRLPLHPTRAALAMHLRKCTKFTRELGETAGFRACHPNLDPCGTCAQLHVDVAQHERGCKGHTTKDRMATTGAHEAELMPGDVGDVHTTFPATCLVEPTKTDVDVLTHGKFLRVLREPEDAHVTELLALARRRGPDDDRASAALGDVVVTREFLTMPSPCGAKKLTMGEFNARVALVETKAWTEVKAALDDAAAPVDSRAPDCRLHQRVPNGASVTLLGCEGARGLALAGLLGPCLVNFQPVRRNCDEVTVFAAAFPWDLVGARPVPALGRGVHLSALHDEELAVAPRVVPHVGVDGSPGLTPWTTLPWSSSPCPHVRCQRRSGAPRTYTMLSTSKVRSHVGTRACWQCSLSCGRRPASVRKASSQCSQSTSRSRPTTSASVVFPSLALGAIFVVSVLPTSTCRSAPSRLASAMPCAVALAPACCTSRRRRLHGRGGRPPGRRPPPGPSSHP